MRPFTVFRESFLDGFTMAGFMTRLRHPSEGAPLFSPSSADKEDWPLVLEHTKEGWEVSGGLRHIPESGLQAMMDLVKREKEGRKKTSSNTSGEAVHGSS